MSIQKNTTDNPRNPTNPTILPQRLYDNTKQLKSRPHWKYKKIQKLGEGTYGTAFLVRNIETNQFCVQKKIKDIDDESEGFSPTQLRELSILQRIKHKNIVKMIEYLISEYYDLSIIFEYCKMDLAKYMEKYRLIPMHTIKRFSYEMLDGLCYLHQQKILHRDLKPANIFISPQNNIKIGDFGLSKEHTLPINRLTTEIVTLWYRSPEILLGCNCYSGMVDIWSIGCIIAEMLRGGKPLFEGYNEWEQIMQIFQFTGTPNQKSWPGCDKILPHFKIKLFPKFKKNKNWKQRIPALKYDTLVINLLERTLEVCPNSRTTAKQLLSHAWFRSLKDSNNNNNIPPLFFERMNTKKEENHKKGMEGLKEDYMHHSLEESENEIFSDYHWTESENEDFDLEEIQNKKEKKYDIIAKNENEKKHLLGDITKQHLKKNEYKKNFKKRSREEFEESSNDNRIFQKPLPKKPKLERKNCVIIQ